MSEADPLDARAHLELPGIVARSRQQLLYAVDRFRSLDCLQIHVAVEDLIGEAAHPRPAFADLAIRNRRQMPGERTAERAHDLLDRLQRDASDQQQIVSHGSVSPPGSFLTATAIVAVRSRAAEGPGGGIGSDWPCRRRAYNLMTAAGRDVPKSLSERQRACRRRAHTSENQTERPFCGMPRGTRGP